MDYFNKRRITRREMVVEDFHGVPVADPYRWLEDDVAPEVVAWTAEQNADFERYISAFDDRAAFKNRLTALWNYEKAQPPEFVAATATYYAWRNNGLQNQYALYASKVPGEVGELVFDPNTLSDDGTVAVISHRISPKGRYMAYGLASKGSDWQTFHVLDLKTKQSLPDVLHHIKFSHMTWLPDESGFFYSRYPDPKAQDVLKAEALNSMVYLHLLGTDQESDVAIHSDPQNPTHRFEVYADDALKWLFLHVSYSTLHKNQLFFKPMAKLESPWLPISDNFDNGYWVVGVGSDVAYVETQKDAPFMTIFAVELTEQGAGQRRTIIPDTGEMIERAWLAGGRLLVSYLQQAVNALKVFDLTGKLLKTIGLPAPGTVLDCSAKQCHHQVFIQFSSVLYPETVLLYDIDTEELTTWFAPKIDFDFNDYETTAHYATSKDGARVPMFVTHKKGMALDGTNPALLYGYGGFNFSMTPYFAVSNLAWLERGGVYATACLRGGSEFGEAWHRAGMLESKQNTFDDFIACGQYLIDKGFTSRKGLGINGGSNGGLLTGACLTQRPDLFGAVIVAVPVLDMLRYHLFTAGRLWTGEYGCAENPEEFEFLYKYSPLHNVRTNVAYPPTLIMTADTDDRVVPMQARKFAATLQMADAGNNPLLIRTDIGAGHGMGKPTAKVIAANADMFTFLLVNLRDKT